MCIAPWILRLSTRTGLSNYVSKWIQRRSKIWRGGREYSLPAPPNQALHLTAVVVSVFRAHRLTGPNTFSSDEHAVDETTKQQQYEAAVRKHGDPIRVLAESAILRYIDELTGDAEARYHEMNSVCFPGMDGIGEFEVGASVTVAQVEGIRQLWMAEKTKNARLTPMEFARANAQEVFYPEVEVCDP
jgi:hypothetical protein